MDRHGFSTEYDRHRRYVRHAAGDLSGAVQC